MLADQTRTERKSAHMPWASISEALCDGHSVEVELVALDVLHHHARLVLLIGKQ